mmetsp:Transcript_77320/g.153492  ORF Transcript_77320/g.153492 Transcript_77320/m.153492 type:complete len:246 (+) Transcript_77320:123-860(+)
MQIPSKRAALASRRPPTLMIEHVYMRVHACACRSYAHHHALLAAASKAPNPTPEAACLVTLKIPLYDPRGLACLISSRLQALDSFCVRHNNLLYDVEVPFACKRCVADTLNASIHAPRGWLERYGTAIAEDFDGLGAREFWHLKAEQAFRAEELLSDTPAALIVRSIVVPQAEVATAVGQANGALRRHHGRLVRVENYVRLCAPSLNRDVDLLYLVSFQSTIQTHDGADGASQLTLVHIRSQFTP